MKQSANYPTLFKLDPDKTISDSRYNQLIDYYERFCEEFPYNNEGHFLLVCMASFPMVLTADLLYRIRTNFQFVYSSPKEKKRYPIPYEAISDLLVRKELVREVGFERFEMYPDIRNYLSKLLYTSPVLGHKRVHELALFLENYTKRYLYRQNEQKLAYVQLLTAEAFLRPEEAAKKITKALNKYSTSPSLSGERQFIEFADSVSIHMKGYEYLQKYVQGLSAHLKGDKEKAKELFQGLPVSNEGEVDLETGLNLRFPDLLRDYLGKPVADSKEIIEENDNNLPIVQPINENLNENDYSHSDELFSQEKLDIFYDLIQKLLSILIKEGRFGLTTVFVFQDGNDGDDKRPYASYRFPSNLRSVEILPLRDKLKFLSKYKIHLDEKAHLSHKQFSIYRTYHDYKSNKLDFESIDNSVKPIQMISFFPTGKRFDSQDWDFSQIEQTPENFLRAEEAIIYQLSENLYFHNSEYLPVPIIAFSKMVGMGYIFYQKDSISLPLENLDYQAIIKAISQSYEKIVVDNNPEYLDYLTNGPLLNHEEIFYNLIGKTGAIAEERINDIKRERLKKLDLSNLGLKDIPEELKDFVWLEELILGNIENTQGNVNEISDIKRLIHLKNLKILNLKGNKISDISPISNLNRLEKLDLGNNAIIDISALGHLKKLQSLQLNHNFIKEIGPLSRLTRLKKLDLSNNDIINIEPLFSLKNLEILNLNKSKVEDLGVISNLDSLKELDAEDCSILSLEPKIFNLSKLEYLSISGNPIKNIPSEIIEQKENLPILKDWWTEQEKGASNLKQNTRLVVLGNNGVGKTSVINRIVNNIFNHSEPTTHNVNISQLTLSLPNNELFETRLNIWDFGGEEALFNIYKQFLNKENTLYMIVWDEENEQLNYSAQEFAENQKPYSNFRIAFWIKLIKSFDKNAPILIVQNKIDIHRKRTPKIQKLNKNDPQIIDYYHVSSLSGQGIEVLASGLGEIVQNFPQSVFSIPISWQKTISRIQSFQQRGINTISRKEFSDICNSLGIQKTLESSILSYLHNRGWLYFISSNPIIALDLSWIIQAVYSLIVHPSHNEDDTRLNLGVFSGKELQSIWNNYSNYERAFFVSFLLLNNLCLEIDLKKKDNFLSSRESKYFFPNTLAPLIPNHLKVFWNNREAIYFIFKLNISGLDFVYKFLIRMVEIPETYEAWKNGIALQHEKEQAIIELNETKGELKIRITPQGKYLFDLVKKTIDELTNASSLKRVSLDGINYVDLGLLKSQDNQLQFIKGENGIFHSKEYYLPFLRLEQKWDIKFPEKLSTSNTNKLISELLEHNQFYDALNLIKELSPKQEGPINLLLEKFQAFEKNRQIGIEKSEDLQITFDELLATITQMLNEINNDSEERKWGSLEEDKKVFTFQMKEAYDTLSKEGHWVEKILNVQKNADAFLTSIFSNVESNLNIKWRSELMDGKGNWREEVFFNKLTGRLIIIGLKNLIEAFPHFFKTNNYPKGNFKLIQFLMINKKYKPINEWDKKEISWIEKVSFDYRFFIYHFQISVKETYNYIDSSISSRLLPYEKIWLEEFGKKWIEGKYFSQLIGTSVKTDDPKHEIIFLLNQDKINQALIQIGQIYPGYRDEISKNFKLLNELDDQLEKEVISIEKAKTEYSKIKEGIFQVLEEISRDKTKREEISDGGSLIDFISNLLFPRRKRKLVSFPALEASGLENRYFYRTSRYTRVGETLRVLNSDYKPSVIPLTPWEARIFERASGMFTIGEFMHNLANEYKNPKLVPRNLDGVLLNILEKMIKDYGILKISDTPIELPSYLSLPIHQQDEEKTKILMAKDGFKD